MKVGIVGSEARKFTAETQDLARQVIRSLLPGADLVVSGRSPIGGIDIWAIEEALRAGIPTREHPPGVFQWKSVGDKDGFEARNLKIARDSDLVVCITVKTLPPGYTGRRFTGGCYHCRTLAADHVKSGGCWTMKRAAEMGKQTRLEIIEPLPF